MRYPDDSRPAVHSMEKFNFSHLWYALKRPCAHKKRCEKLNFSIEWTARRESLSYKSKYCNVQNSEKNYSKFDSTCVAHRPYYHLSNIQHLGKLTLAINKAWLTTHVESQSIQDTRGININLDLINKPWINPYFVFISRDSTLSLLPFTTPMSITR